MKTTMHENFKQLKERVNDALKTTDLIKTKEVLSSIQNPTIVTGVGGSKVVSVFTSKILAKKNGIIAEAAEPRDVIYKTLSGYANIVACSYSGTNFGVQTSFVNDLDKYLLSSTNVPGVKNITYQTTLPKEKSFISLAATLIPMSIMLEYYLDGNIEVLDEIFAQAAPEIERSKVFEIMSGFDSATAHTYLESTMVESSIATPIVHDKYSFCHGRTTTGYHNNHSLIYFDKNTELDSLMLEELQAYYSKIIRLKSRFSDPIIDDYYLTLQSMLLTQSLAEQNDIDLSIIDYSPVVKKLYHFKGEM